MKPNPRGAQRSSRWWAVRAAFSKPDADPGDRDLSFFAQALFLHVFEFEAPPPRQRAEVARRLRITQAGPQLEVDRVVGFLGREAEDPSWHQYASHAAEQIVQRADVAEDV